MGRLCLSVGLLSAYFFESGHRYGEAADAESIGAATGVLFQFVQQSGQLVDASVRQNERQFFAAVARQFRSRHVPPNGRKYFAASIAILEDKPTSIYVRRMQV